MPIQPPTTLVRAWHLTAMADRLVMSASNRMIELASHGPASRQHHRALRAVNRRKAALARLARALDHQVSEARLREAGVRHFYGDHSQCLPAQCLTARRPR